MQRDLDFDLLLYLAAQNGSCKSRIEFNWKGRRVEDADSQIG